MNPNHGKYMDVVFATHDGCQYEPRERRGALISDRHFRNTHATLLVGSRNGSTGIQYRLCAECGALPLFNGKNRLQRPIRKAKHS